MYSINHTPPKISVIIPLYNKAPFIKRALDSVLAQTVQEFEILVVGGNSSDGSEDIVKRYTDSRICFIQETRNGVSAARNQGVDAARADLVAFLDADDEWLPKYLETILRLREKYPNGGIYSTAWSLRTPSKTYVNWRYKGIPDGFEGAITSVFRLTTENYCFPGYTSSIVIPKNTYIKSTGFSEKYRLGEDLDLWARLALHYPWIHSSKALVIYNQDDPNSAVRNLALLSTNEHPFLQSFHTLITPDEQQRLLKKLPGLELYLDSLHLWKTGNLITLGLKKEAIAELKKITHNELNSKKRILYFKIYTPKNLLPIARGVYKLISCFLGLRRIVWKR